MTDFPEIASSEVINYAGVSHVSVDQNFETYLDGVATHRNTRRAMIVAGFLLDPNRVQSFEEVIESARRLGNEEYKSPNARQITQASNPNDSPIGLNTVHVGKDKAQKVCVFIADTTDLDLLGDVRSQVGLIGDEMLDKFELKLQDKIIRSKIIFEEQHDPIDPDVLEIAEQTLLILEFGSFTKPMLLRRLIGGEKSPYPNLSSTFDRAINWLSRTQKVKLSQSKSQRGRGTVTQYSLCNGDSVIEDNNNPRNKRVQYSVMQSLRERAAIPTTQGFLSAMLDIPAGTTESFQDYTRYFYENCESLDQKTRIAEAFFILVNYGYFEETNVKDQYTRTNATPRKIQK